MLEVGIKATCDWRDRPEWLTYTAEAGDPIKALQGLGVDYCEFSFWDRTSSTRWSAAEEADLVLAAARPFIAAGMQVHLHPYVHQDQRGPGFLEGDSAESVITHLEMAVDLAARVAHEQGYGTTVVFHPADNPIPSGTGAKEMATLRRKLLKLSKEFFQYGEAHVSRTGVPVNIVCEMPPPSSSRVRIGETPTELLEVVADTDLGLCWDTGHYSMCAVKHGFPDIPDEEFLLRVSHAHIHGVVNGNDHNPIEPNDEYNLKCVRELSAIERRVRVTLEYRYVKAEASTASDMHNVLKVGVQTVKPLAFTG